jgi:indoleacetamide hydrolase
MPEGLSRRGACGFRGSPPRGRGRIGRKSASQHAAIGPTTPRVAVAQGPEASSLPTSLLFIRNTDPGSNAGLPGLMIPAGLGPGTGLPVGLSLDGPAAATSACSPSGWRSKKL